MRTITFAFIIIAVTLLIGDVFFGTQYFSARDKYESLLTTTRINSKIVAFNKLFVDKVLKNTGDVSYEDRLKLENAVVDTRDKDIVDAWHKFLDSRTEAEAQNGTKTLLSLFADKMVY